MNLKNALIETVYKQIKSYFSSVLNGLGSKGTHKNQTSNVF